MSTYMQSAFKTLSALLLSAKAEINIYPFINHRNKESTPRLSLHHMTVFERAQTFIRQRLVRKMATS